METFLLLCQPIIRPPNYIRPQVKTCRVVIKKCDAEKCIIVPAEKAPDVDTNYIKNNMH